LIHEAAELLDGVLGGGPHCAPPREARAGSSRDRRERAGSTQLEGRFEFLVVVCGRRRPLLYMLVSHSTQAAVCLGDGLLVALCERRRRGKRTSHFFFCSEAYVTLLNFHFDSE
jgi:hypothetical protein